MKNLFFAFSTATLLLTACKEKEQRLSVAEYNEQAITTFNMVSSEMARSREQLYYNLQTPDAHMLMLGDLRTSIDSAIVMTERLKYPEDAAALHEHILALYRYEKDSIVPLYEETLQYPVDGRKWFGVWDIYEIRNRTVSSMLEQMTALQQEMAAKMQEEKK